MTYFISVDAIIMTPKQKQLLLHLSAYPTGITIWLDYGKFGLEVDKIPAAQRASDLETVEKIKYPAKMYGPSNKPVCSFCFNEEKCYCRKIWMKCKREVKKAILNQKL